MLQLNRYKTTKIAMNTVTQKLKFRQFLLKYADKNGATKAVIRYPDNSR